ncbi:MFS transporter [Pelagicoccus sp. SDUM812003]|uniref:MFS transporter n=1 Tax=Pelagicoccus sp. SDUM812003 TaxID=3041267 RepID=UPI00280CC09C|nr:MFS transporter [Pelagicoccus sp. SDUM812003]MDQ8203026.1 MFS transporter [Pelagicoccus sp. SDUM812003]
MSQPTPQSTPRKQLSLGIIFLTIFIDLVGFSVIFPLFPSILDYYLELDGDAGVLAWILQRLDAFSHTTGGGERFTPVLFGGLLGSLYATLQFFFAPLWGSVSDQKGRRPILLITTLGTCLSYVLWLFAGNFALLIAARLIGGAMSGNLSVATAAVADVTTKENRSKGMGLIGVAFGLGFVVGPAIGGLCVMVNPLDWYPELAELGINPFSFVAFVAVLLSLANFLWIRARFVESLPPENRGASKLPRNPIARLTQPQSGAVRRTNLAYLVYILAFSGMEFTLSFLGVERFGYTPGDITKMMIFIGFILIVVQGGIVRRLAPKIGEKATALAGLTLVAIGLGFLSRAETQPLLYTGLGFMALGAGLCSPTLTSLVSLYAKPEEQGRALGVFRSLGSLGRAIGPVAASFIFWWFGSDTLYLAGAAIVVVATALCLRLPRPDKSETA